MIHTQRCVHARVLYLLITGVKWPAADALTVGMAVVIYHSRVPLCHAIIILCSPGKKTRVIASVGMKQTHFLPKNCIFITVCFYCNWCDGIGESQVI